MREVKVRILDEDTVSDLVGYLYELEGDLVSMQKHLEDLKGILERHTEDSAMPEDELQIDVETLAANIKEYQRTLEKLLNSKWHISECTLGEERSWTVTREKNGL